MKPNIGISDKNRQKIAETLNALLADEHVLYIKVRNYHWNVTGPNFTELHKLFESQYTELEEIIDGTAERIRQLGHYADGSLKHFLKATRLTEGEGAGSSSKMIQNLLNDHETIIRVLRNDIPAVNDDYKDVGNADFLTGLLEQHEKMAWFLRAYL